MTTRTARTKPKQAASPSTLDRMEREVKGLQSLAWELQSRLADLLRQIRVSERR